MTIDTQHNAYITDPATGTEKLYEFWATHEEAGGRELWLCCWMVAVAELAHHYNNCSEYGPDEGLDAAIHGEPSDFEYDTTGWHQPWADGRDDAALGRGAKFSP